MRGALRVICIAGLIGGGGHSVVFAEEKALTELPKDVTDLAFVWTEPIKSVAEQSRRFDPVSGLWFGLLAGTVKSVERTVKILIPEETHPSRTPRAPDVRLRYTF